MKIPNFNTKSEKIKFFKDNKDVLIAAKKYSVKHADSFSYSIKATTNKGEAIKMEMSEQVDLETIKVLSVINTTNLFDSHSDVHIPGLWTKSLSELKRIYLLQEHEMCFDKIITDKISASVKNYNWSELGYPEYKGQTQALLFDSEIDSDRNEFMFEQYLKGYVNNHSIGMVYVNLFLCIDSDEKYYKEEKANWDKYISQVANQQDAIDNGLFWAVTEAKIIEGSAVVMGSNFVTPTLNISQGIIEAEAITSTKSEPQKSTLINYEYLKNNLKK